MQGAVEVWAALPHEIRRDPSLASFRQHHQRLNGNVLFCVVIFVAFQNCH